MNQEPIFDSVRDEELLQAFINIQNGDDTDIIISSLDEYGGGHLPTDRDELELAIQKELKKRGI